MSRRPKPLDDLGAFLERLGREFDAATSSWNPEFTPRGGLGWSLQDREPNVDVADYGHAFVVSADVPGYDADDLEIQVSAESLQIRGTRDQTRDRDGASIIRHERQASSFNRRVALPDPIETDAVDATLNNGVLTVTLAKRQPADEPRRIDID